MLENVHYDLIRIVAFALLLFFHWYAKSVC